MPDSISGSIPEEAHREEFKVRVFESGPHGCATPTTLADYMQEGAAEHARKLGVSMEMLLDNNLAWVLGRLRIHVARYPSVRESVTLHTLHTEKNKRWCGRDYVFTGEQGALLARAATNWAVMDVASRKMITPPELIARIYNQDRNRLLDFETRAVQRLSEPEHETVVHVRESDLDINGHTNNVRYISWITDSIPAEYRTSKQLEDIDISFRAESVQNDVITCCCGCVDGAWLHSLIRERDHVEIVRARTVWMSTSPV